MLYKVILLLFSETYGRQEKFQYQQIRTPKGEKRENREWSTYFKVSKTVLALMERMEDILFKPLEKKQETQPYSVESRSKKWHRKRCASPEGYKPEWGRTWYPGNRGLYREIKGMPKKKGDPRMQPCTRQKRQPEQLRGHQMTARFQSFIYSVPFLRQLEKDVLPQKGINQSGGGHGIQETGDSTEK